MNNKQYSLPPIADILSLPGQRLMDHALKNRLTESPGLLLHTLLCRIVAYALAKNLPSEMVDIDILLSLGVVSHSTRVIADEGLTGKHKNSDINLYMQTHSTLDFAHRDGIDEDFPAEILEGILHFINNPRTRVGYFPHETMVYENGEINWTEALYQISSWSIAGGITTLEKRFDDLRNRRSEEIGKLELDYIKEKIQLGEEYLIPDPILNSASVSLGYTVTSDMMKLFIVHNQVDDGKIGEWILNSYQTWADSVRKKYCEIIGVDDFDDFLQEQVDVVKDSNLRLKIQKAFEVAIGRSLRDDEFFPTIPGMDILYKRIGAMKVGDVQQRAKQRVEKLMGNIERVTKKFLTS